MGLSKWLAKADAKNQVVVDALLGHPHVAGPGVIIVSRWSQGEHGGYREGRSVVSVDGGRRVRLLWGSSFHPLSPGTHHLKFGWLLPSSSAEATIDVPSEGQLRVEYQPASVFWQRASVVVGERAQAS
jgi:hypothetical protein